MVESKALDGQTKMARLLQFLEGPAFKAVQRYEAFPGGLTKALEVLQSRFGQPFKNARACVDTLTKGPANCISRQRRSPTLCRYGASYVRYPRIYELFRRSEH